eukprot:6723002-Prymnesium_polylepis.1
MGIPRGQCALSGVTWDDTQGTGREAKPKQSPRSYLPRRNPSLRSDPVSYTHLRAHETLMNL